MTMPPFGRMLRLLPLVGLLGAPLTCVADSGVGVDTWRANKLDPTGGELTQPLDPNGTSWLVPGEHRSPTGNLYGDPPADPLPGAPERVAGVRQFRCGLSAHLG